MADRTPVPASLPLPFVDLQAQGARLGDQIEAAIARVLAHGRFIMGPEIFELEAQLAAHCGAKHAISCASGTDALALAVMAKEIGPGDAVLMPAFTFVATAEPVAWLGATPIFVDVLESSFNLDPRSLEEGIRTAKARRLTARGVITVDLFGQPADYAAIEAICARHGLWLLADAAQSFGASYLGRRVGQIGELAATSFFPAKPLGCYGDGGCLFTDDDELAAVVRSLRIHGKGRDKYDNVRIGINGRLDTLQAAILLQKLTIFDDELEARQRVAERYDQGLAEVVQTPRLAAGTTSAWAQYAVLVEGGERDRLAEALHAQGIPTAVYYPTPLHRQTAYREFPIAGNGLPVSEGLAARVLSLPMHPYLATAVQDYIIDCVRAHLESVRARDRTG